MQTDKLLSVVKKKCKYFIRIFKKKKIKFIQLKVSAPFHCSLMKSAAKTMEEKIQKTVFKDLNYKIISNVTAEETNNINFIKKIISRANLFNG